MTIKKATGTQDAFLKQQMELLGVMKDTLLTRLGAPTGKASTIRIAPTVEWPTLHESDSDVTEFFQQFKDTAKLAHDGKGME